VDLRAAAAHRCYLPKGAAPGPGLGQAGGAGGSGHWEPP
jgi:hypothetical protein